ncbi:MAG: hypothetical protein NTY88_14980 [Bacteroidetes bacterium]|nr:hypothetical protein [Bacteroidota bacterium]
MKNFILSLVCTAGILFCAAQEVPFKLIAYDKTNRNPIPAAQVKLQNLNSLREYTLLTNDAGQADFMLETGARYRLEVSKNSSGSSIGYLSYTYMLSENEVVAKKTFEAELEKVKHTESGLLPAMYFDYGKAELSVENLASLDNALKMLQSFATLQIEVGVYADCREEKGMTAKRALAISSYLSSKGGTKRITVKEYGNVRALNQCDCSNQFVVCSDEKYLENRRAEFKVIAF